MAWTSTRTGPPNSRLLVVLRDTVGRQRLCEAWMRNTPIPLAIPNMLQLYEHFSHGESDIMASAGVPGLIPVKGA